MLHIIFNIPHRNVILFLPQLYVPETGDTKKARMAERNTSDIGFEKQIWDAACVLRDNIDASEYKSVVLGLIFLSVAGKNLHSTTV